MPQRGAGVAVGLSVLLMFAGGCGTKPAAQRVRPSQVTGPLAVLSPNGGEHWAPAAVVVIRWTPSMAAGDRVHLDLLRGGTVLRRIETDAVNDGNHPWSVPADFTEGDDYTVRVSAGADMQDVSDAPFTIGAPTIARYAALTPGRTWTYETKDGGTLTATVRTDTVEIDGVATTVVEEDTGRREFYQLSDDGFFLHRLDLPENNQTITFRPPVHLAARTLTLGARARSAGVAETVTGEAPPEPVAYSALAEIERFPTIPGPDGRVATVKIGGLLLLGDARIPFNLWLAPGLGQVKHTGDRSFKLLHTSAPAPPDSTNPPPA